MPSWVYLELALGKIVMLPIGQNFKSLTGNFLTYVENLANF